MRVKVCAEIAISCKRGKEGLGDVIEDQAIQSKGKLNEYKREYLDRDEKIEVKE